MIVSSLIDTYINIFKGLKNPNIDTHYNLKCRYIKLSKRYRYELYIANIIIDKYLQKVQTTSPYAEAMYSLIYSLEIDTLQISSGIANFSLLYNYLYIKDAHIKQNILARLLYTMEYDENCVLEIGLITSEDLCQHFLKIQEIPKVLKSLISDLFCHCDARSIKYQTIKTINPKSFYKKTCWIIHL
jgi:hypothetical protein